METQNIDKSTVAVKHDVVRQKKTKKKQKRLRKVLDFAQRFTAED